MSDSPTMDLTFLSGLMQEVGRDLRLMRLQMDNMASRLSGLDSRIGALEQSFHEIIGEMSRAFGQQQQQISRQDRRFDAVDAGLSELRTLLEDNTNQLLVAIRESRP